MNEQTEPPIYIKTDSKGIGIGISILIHGVVLIELGLHHEITSNPSLQYPNIEIAAITASSALSPSSAQLSASSASTQIAPPVKTRSNPDLALPETQPRAKPIPNPLKPQSQKKMVEPKTTERPRQELNDSDHRTESNSSESTSVAGSLTPSLAIESSASQATTLPDYRSATLHNPPTTYPSQALRHQIQGSVRLNVLVMSNGLAGQIYIVGSSGSEILDESAVEQVRRWHFLPAKRGNVPIEAWVVIPISFRLAR